MACFIPVSTYMLYMDGKLLFDKAFMWEYTKLATCKLLSFIATLAMVVIKGRAGLVSKITAQAIIRTSGGSDWSARIWMRYPCTCRDKPCLELPIIETLLQTGSTRNPQERWERVSLSPEKGFLIFFTPWFHIILLRQLKEPWRDSPMVKGWHWIWIKCPCINVLGKPSTIKKISA